LTRRQVSRPGQPTDDKVTVYAADAITPWLTTNQFLDKLDTNLQKAMAS
jgi:hypothetical protein